MVNARAGALAIATLGCSGDTRPAAVSTASRQPSVSIDGQVFIVQRNQEVRKLALVDILVLPATDLAALKARAEEAMQSVDAAGERLRRAQRTVRDAKARMRQLYDGAIDHPREQRHAMLEEGDRIGESLVELERREAKAQADLAAACAASPLPNPDALHPVTRATSDADGKFHASGLVLGERYIVAAWSSRQVLGAVERYFWLIPLPAKTTAEHLQLDNRNLLTHEKTDALIKIPKCMSL